MDECLYSHKVTDHDTGEVRWWCLIEYRWCSDCEGITVKQALNIQILENQMEARGEIQTTL